MRQFHWKSLTLGLALVLAATVGTGTATLHAQDRPNDQGEQRSAPAHNAQPAEHSRENTRPEANARPEEGLHARDQGDHDDAVARYRKDHPSAAARCHDGFFTRTADRRHACTKHGGIDVWLEL